MTIMTPQNPRYSSGTLGAQQEQISSLARYLPFSHTLWVQEELFPGQAEEGHPQGVELAEPFYLSERISIIRRVYYLSDTFDQFGRKFSRIRRRWLERLFSILWGLFWSWRFFPHILKKITFMRDFPLEDQSFVYIILFKNIILNQRC